MVSVKEKEKLKYKVKIRTMDDCQIIECPVDDVQHLNDEQVKTPKRKRKPVSASKKKKMLENLAKAREVAKSNREHKNKKPRRKQEVDYSSEEDEPVPEPRHKVKSSKIKPEHKPKSKPKYYSESDSDSEYDSEPESPVKRSKKQPKPKVPSEKQKRLQIVEDKLDKILKYTKKIGKGSAQPVIKASNQIIEKPYEEQAPKPKPASIKTATRLLSFF